MSLSDDENSDSSYKDDSKDTINVSKMSKELKQKSEQIKNKLRKPKTQEHKNKLKKPKPKLVCRIFDKKEMALGNFSNWLRMENNCGKRNRN